MTIPTLLQRLGIDPTAPMESLDLSHKFLRGSDVLMLAEGFKDSNSFFLKTLKLGFNDLKDEGVAVISRYLTHFPSLTCLDLGFNGVGDDGALALASALACNCRLRILYLSGNTITANGFRHLATALQTNTNLVSLHLTGNSGNTDGTAWLAQSLTQNSTLGILCLNGNNIKPQGAASIAELLSSHHSITHINLSDNKIADEGAASLGSALRVHRSMKSLELSFNSITPLGIDPLCEYLVDYHSLRRLYLDNNKIGNKGASAVARKLQTMELEELNIGFNEISAEGLTDLLRCVVTHKTLKSLVLSGNSISNDVARIVAFMLVYNSTLKCLYLDHTSLGPIGEKHIAAGIATNRTCGLATLTGFDLGRALTFLGSPPQLASCSNEIALRYLAEMWRAQQQQQVQQQQQMQTTTAAPAGGGTEGETLAPAAAPAPAVIISSHHDADHMDYGRDINPPNSVDVVTTNAAIDEDSSPLVAVVSHGSVTTTTALPIISIPAPIAASSRLPILRPGLSEATVAVGHGSPANDDPSSVVIAPHTNHLYPTPLPRPATGAPFLATSVTGNGHTVCGVRGLFSSPDNSSSRQPRRQHISAADLDLNISHEDMLKAFSSARFGDDPVTAATAAANLVLQSTNCSADELLALLDSEMSDSAALHVIDEACSGYSHVDSSTGETNNNTTAGGARTAEEEDGMVQGTFTYPSFCSPNSTTNGDAQYTTTTTATTRSGSAIMIMSSSFACSSSLTHDVTKKNGSTSKISGTADVDDVHHFGGEPAICIGAAGGISSASSSSFGKTAEGATAVGTVLNGGGQQVAAFLSWRPPRFDDPSTSHPLPLFVQAAKEVAKAPFDPAELWELHQYYFSPPNPQESEEDEDSECEEEQEEEDEDETTSSDDIAVGRGSGSGGRHRRRCSADRARVSPRPKKRIRNRSTMSRIACYPRIKHKLEQFKSQANDEGTLQLLRQLRFLENECQEEIQDIDLEGVLLDVIIG